MKHDMEALKTAAQKAGMIDPGDALLLVDASSDKNATELVAELQRQKPFLFQPKMAKDMTEAERAAALAELRKGPKPEPMSVDRMASQMSVGERETWLREHSRRFG
jgi:hypothetical protein